MARRGWIILGALITLMGVRLVHAHAVQPKPQPLTVAAASDLAKVLPPLGQEFTKRTQIPVTFVFGATRQLEIQVAQGAPYDLLAGVNLNAPPAQATPFAQGQAVLVVSKGALACPQSVGQVLQSQQVQHIAVPTPSHAPFGQAALQSLKAMGLPTDSPKFVYAKNAQESVTLLTAGSVEAAFTSRSLVPSRVCTILLPKSTYQPLILGASVPQANPSAKAFQKFLTTPWAQKRLAQAGYAMPPRR